MIYSPFVQAAFLSNSTTVTSALYRYCAIPVIWFFCFFETL